MPVRISNFDSPAALADFVNADPQKATAAAVVGGGTDYEDDDILTVLGGEGDAVTLKVTAQTGGVITAVSIEFEGAYVTDPTNPVSVTGGSGNGATFNLTLASVITATSDVREILERDRRWYLEYWT